jgi:hypothetical protein
LHELAGVLTPRDGVSPLRSPLETPDDLIWRSPIVRWAAEHHLTILAANVDGSDGNPLEWEARIQALSALLTGNESLLGGAAWEMKAATLRHNARLWLLERLAVLNAD